MTTTILLFIAGLVILIVGADLLVRGASRLAAAFGVSPLVIGLTIVAIGTASPEIAVSLQAAVNGQGDLTLGNVLGSNIFNLLGVLGLGAFLAPDGISVAERVLRLDFIVMVFVALVCLPVFYIDNRISRVEGTLLLGYYVLICDLRDFAGFEKFHFASSDFVYHIFCADHLCGVSRGCGEIVPFQNGKIIYRQVPIKSFFCGVKFLQRSTNKTWNCSETL